MKSLYGKLFIIAFSVLFITTMSYADIQPKGVNIQKDVNSYKINFDLPEYDMSLINAEGNNYIKLTIPGYGETSVAGLPLLPLVSFNLMVAYEEGTPQVTNIQLTEGVRTLSNRLFPAQEPWEKSKSLSDRPFTINEEYYNTEGVKDAPFVIVAEPFIIAGVKGIRVTIYPFRYNPLKNELTYVTKGSFNIDLDYPIGMNIVPTETMNSYLKSVFVKYENTNNIRTTSNYLIITAPEYESNLSSFVTHKTGMGYSVFVANTTVTGTTNTAIKTYIQQRYNNMSTRPEFILFVGDVDKIPGWIGTGAGTPYTDLNYGCLDGTDPYVDAFVGRFSISNSTQLGNIISKSIFMENNINSLPKKNVFMSSTDNWAITEGTHNFVIDSFFAPAGYINLKLYTHTYNATTTQLIAALNANQSFAIYSGHGSVTSWADGPPLNQSQVNALTNTVYPYVYSFACLTGQFQAAECFGETWIRTANAGSVFWGSSVNSYWDEDDILEKRLFRAMFTNNLIKTAPMYAQAKIYLVNHYGSITPTMQRYIEMYNCLGDPSMYEASYGPSIIHTPLPNTENVIGPYLVNCEIYPVNSPIDPSKTRLFWTRSTIFSDSVLLMNTGGNNWTASIPGNGLPAEYRYYIKTADMMSVVTTSPPQAPSAYYSFIANADTVAPVITHTPLPDQPKNTWPATVNAEVADNIGVESVWVKWYKNTPSTVHQFNLSYTSGNSYSAAFNSDTSQVSYNDIIYYRVFARDNSSAHNVDSTALYNFTIIAQTTACIGSGSTSVSYPFYTYYEDSKTDMLFTASEIIANGGSSGNITKIAFDVISSAPQTMNGFQVKMQHTTATSLTGFVTSGWTTVCTGTCSITGTGLVYIPLTTPFQWNGTDNLLIEICFDNNDWTANSTVKGTSAPGMTWHRHVDNDAGCSLTGGSAQTNRPNICLEINMLTGNQNISNIIPKEFSLEQNYPNPFNPVTKIKYSIAKTSLTKLKIYDVLGREMMVLVNEVLTPGVYIADFNGNNMASGVYFYRIEAGSFVDVKKMLLIK